MGRPLTPFNLDPLFIKPNELRTLEQVKVPDIFEGSSQNFHDEGLFSNRIFGNVGTEQRDNTFAYIDIKLAVLHPFMLKCVTQLRGFYKDLIAGKVYAIWDEKEKDFVASNAIDGSTGFYFFLNHWKDIKFKRTSSRLRDERIAYYEKFKDISEIDKVMVYPAGLRDVQVDEIGRVKKDEVNDHYLALIGISNAISRDISRGNTNVMDTTRLSLQNAFVRVYEHFFNILAGKGGSIQKQLASRNIYYGSRNVITPFSADTVNLSSPYAPSPSNTVMGLYQLMNASLPFVRNWMLTSWTQKAFSAIEGSATLIDPESWKPELVKLSPEVIDRWTTTSGIETLVENFQYPNLRSKPVLIEGRYLALVYQNENFFKVMWSIDELPDDPEYSKKDVHPLTYIEMFYLSGYQHWNKLALYNTRYPVEGNGSIYPSYAYLRTTLKDYQLYELGDDWKPIGEDNLALSFPDIKEQNYMDAMSVAPCHLAASGADHDGDMFSANVVFTDEAIAEVARKLNDPTYYLDPRGGFMYSAMTEIVDRVIRNITE